MTLFYPPYGRYLHKDAAIFLALVMCWESFTDRGSYHLWFDSQLDIKRLDCITAAFANSAYDLSIP